jgi:cardiolipin synthase
VIVISRDVVILFGFSLLFLLTQREIEIRPSAFGKATTFFQLLSVIAVVMRLYGAQAITEGVLTVIFVVTAVVTVVAGLQYMYRGLAWLQRQPAASPGVRPPDRERDRPRDVGGRRAAG